LISFCIAALARADAGFLYACSLRSRNLGNLVDYFPAGIVRVRGCFNLVDFYKVSLAARDGFHNVIYRVIIR